MCTRVGGGTGKREGRRGVLFKIEEFNGHCMRVHLSMRFQAADNTGVSAI